MKQKPYLYPVLALALGLALFLAGCAIQPVPGNTTPAVGTTMPKGTEQGTQATMPAPEATLTPIETTASPQTATPPPVEEATLPPATAQPSTPPSESASSDVSQVLGSWQWVQFNDPGKGSTNIDQPEKYVLTFEEDGQVTVQADCNTAQGRYTLQDSSIEIVLGPTTLAYCGDQSHSDDFLTYLGSAAIYQVDGDQLILDLVADSGAMIFERAETSQPPTSDSLVGTWQWTRFEDPVAGSVAIRAPERYLVQFGPNGGVKVKAACNLVHGIYVADQHTLSIKLLPLQLSQCATKHRGEYFLLALDAAGTYAIKADRLRIDLVADGGSLFFARTDLPLKPEKPASPSPKPTRPPTSSRYQRVRFGNNPSVNLNGVIQKGQPKGYILSAKKDQMLEIRTESAGEPLQISVKTAQGKQVKTIGKNGKIVNDVVVRRIPKNGDYLVIIKPVIQPESPTLQFTITFIRQ